MSPDGWPAHIEINAIERCPVYLRNLRENFYITKYNVVESGLNSGTVIADDETNAINIRSQLDRNNEKRKQKRSCKYCGKEMNLSSVTRHEKSYCKANPSNRASTSSDNQ